MKRILNVFKGDGKRSTESICKTFYTAALKLLKRHFGNTFYVSPVKLSELFDKPQIKANNLITLRHFE